jgi:hypothetical protein
MPKEEALLCKIITVNLMKSLRGVRLNNVLTMCGWYNLQTIDIQMQILLANADKAGRTVLSGDVSNFDASIPPELMIDLGAIIGRWVRGGEHLADNLVRALTYKTGLVTPDKFWPETMSSMKSGSGFTNLLDSLINLTILFYGEEMGYYKIQDACVLGDDFVIDGEGVNPESVTKAFSDFGMESHPDKQFYEEKALHYLQRLHYLGRPGGIASVMRTLGHALGFENMVYRPGDFNSYTFVVRALSQVQNCAFNPFLLPLLNTLKDGDKYKLGAEITNPKELLTMSGKAGEDILRINTTATWKRSGVPFENWLVNGALRGEEPPQAGNALFRRVYGQDPVGN